MQRDETKYYDPNHKEDFNYDLILSNNYICHFLVMDADLMKKLAFRPECDGAQDYDLAAAGSVRGAGCRWPLRGGENSSYSQSAVSLEMP